MKKFEYLTVRNCDVKLFDSVMNSIRLSGRVQNEDVLEDWADKVQECMYRLGEEFRVVFLKELRRQVLRQGGMAYPVEDKIVVNTLAQLVTELDAVLDFKTHPTLEMVCRGCRNRLAPVGNVLYRMTRMVMRRNHKGNVFTQVALSLPDGEGETVMDIIDNVLLEEERAYVG